MFQFGKMVETNADFNTRTIPLLGAAEKICKAQL
jgi:hypothetical protein